MASENSFARELKQSMQSKWATDKGAEQARKVASAVGGKKGAFAECLRKAMETGSAGVDVYKKCAESADLRGKLISAWGE